MDQRGVARVAAITEALVGLGVGIATLDAGFILIGLPAVLSLGAIVTGMSIGLWVVATRKAVRSWRSPALIVLSLAMGAGLLTIGAVVRGPFLAFGLLGCGSGIVTAVATLRSPAGTVIDNGRPPSPG